MHSRFTKQKSQPRSTFLQMKEWFLRHSQIKLLKSEKQELSARTQKLLQQMASLFLSQIL